MNNLYMKTNTLFKNFDAEIYNTLQTRYPTASKIEYDMSFDFWDIYTANKCLTVKAVKTVKGLHVHRVLEKNI